MFEDGPGETELAPRKPRRRLRRANSLKDLGLLIGAAMTTYEGDHRRRQFRERAEHLHEIEATIREAFFGLLLRDLGSPQEDQLRVKQPALRWSSHIPGDHARKSTRINCRVYKDKQKRKFDYPHPHPVHLPLSYPRGMNRTQAIEYARKFWAGAWTFEPSRADRHLRLNDIMQAYGRADRTVMGVDRHPDDRRPKPRSIDVDEIEFELAEIMCASPVIRAYIRGGFYGTDEWLVGQALKRVTETHKKLIDEIMAIRRADPAFKKKVWEAEKRRFSRKQLDSPKLAQPRWQVPNDDPHAWKSKMSAAEGAYSSDGYGMHIHKPRKKGEPKPFGEEPPIDDMASRRLDRETRMAWSDEGTPLYDDYSEASGA